MASTNSGGAFSDLSKDPWTLRDPAATPLPLPLPHSISQQLELAAEAAALSRGSQSVLGAVHAPVRAPQNSSELARGPLWSWSPRRLRFERCDACVAQDFDDAWCFFFGAGQRLPVACIRRVRVTSVAALQFRVDTFVDGSLSFRAPAPAGALHYWVATLQHLALRAAAPPECYAGGRVDGATRALQAAWRGALAAAAPRAHAASATLSRVRSRVAVGSAMPPPQPCARRRRRCGSRSAPTQAPTAEPGTSSDAPLPILSEAPASAAAPATRRRRRWRTRAPGIAVLLRRRRRKGSR